MPLYWFMKDGDFDQDYEVELEYHEHAAYVEAHPNDVELYRQGITYKFYDNDRQQEYAVVMRSEELDGYIEKHPTHELQHDHNMNIGDPLSLGFTKPPSDFQKYVLGKIKAGNPLGSVEKRWNIKREI